MYAANVFKSRGLIDTWHRILGIRKGLGVLLSTVTVSFNVVITSVKVFARKLLARVGITCLQSSFPH